MPTGAAAARANASDLGLQAPPFDIRNSAFGPPSQKGSGVLGASSRGAQARLPRSDKMPATDLSLLNIAFETSASKAASFHCTLVVTGYPFGRPGERAGQAE
jgi:hypothetical protein